MVVRVTGPTYIIDHSQGMIKQYIIQTLRQKTILHICRVLAPRNTRTEGASFILKKVYDGPIAESWEHGQNPEKKLRYVKRGSNSTVSWARTTEIGCIPACKCGCPA